MSIFEDGFSFIIPVLNSEQYIGETLLTLYKAISMSSIEQFEIIIVNDGSTDLTDSIIREMNLSGVLIINQNNQGRLRARLNGIESSKYQNLVLLDSRLLVDQMALVYLTTILRQTDTKMVIAKILFAKSSLVGIFWDGIARIVWRNYYKDDRDVILNITNFDHHPKGTTLLYAEKKVIMDSYALLTTDQLMNQNTNDDTLIIKSIVKHSKVLLSKKMIGMYIPREKFSLFLQHAKHRGYVASDGYFARGTLGRNRLLPTSVFLAALAISSFLIPYLSFALIFLAIGIEIYIYRITSARHFLSLNVYSLPFLVSYLLGFMAYRRDKLRSSI